MGLGLGLRGGKSREEGGDGRGEGEYGEKWREMLELKDVGESSSFLLAKRWKSLAEENANLGASGRAPTRTGLEARTRTGQELVNWL